MWPACFLESKKHEGGSYLSRQPGVKFSATSEMNYSAFSTEELLNACVERENSEAWEEFVRRFHKFIGTVVLRVARRWGETNAAVIDDLIQDTYLKICADNCRLLRDFQATHPNAFFGMLKVTAANVTHDYFRARRSEKRGSGAAESELSEVEAFVEDRHASGPAQMERVMLLRQIDGILTGTSSPSATRDREIFWLYYGQGFTADAIAAIASFKLTVKGVESLLYRLKRLVRQSLAEATRPARIPSTAKGIPGENTFSKGEGQS